MHCGILLAVSEYRCFPFFIIYSYSAHRWKSRWYRQQVSWKTRKEREERGWDDLVEILTDTYLEYWNGDDSLASASSQPTTTSPLSTLQYEYTVEVYDIRTLRTELTIDRSPDSTSPAIDLIRHGYIAKTPRKPTVAVSIDTLQLLYRFRQRKASISMEAFAKVVCDYYSVS